MKALWDNSIHDKEYDVRRHMAKQTTQQDYVLERNARARHDDRSSQKWRSGHVNIHLGEKIIQPVMFISWDLEWLG